MEMPEVGELDSATSWKTTGEAIHKKEKTMPRRSKLNPSKKEPHQKEPTKVADIVRYSHTGRFCTDDSIIRTIINHLKQ